MSKFDDIIDLYKKSFTDKLIRSDYDEDLLRSIAKSLGPSIYNKDASKVACSDKKELAKIKSSFLVKKLGLQDDETLDKAIKEVCNTLGRSNRNKYRVVFYYLLVEKFGKEALYIETKKQKSSAKKTNAKKTNAKKTSTKQSTAEHSKAKKASTKQSSDQSASTKKKRAEQPNIETEDYAPNKASEDIIQKHALYAAGAGLVPIPLMDLVTVSAVQYKMIKKLAGQYSHVAFQKEKAKSIIAGMMGGIGAFELGLFTRIMFKAVPFFGPIVGGTAMSGFSYISTKLIGEIFDDHFASGGNFTIEELTVKKMKETFNFEMKKRKK